MEASVGIALDAEEVSDTCWTALEQLTSLVWLILGAFSSLLAWAKIPASLCLML
ncbi:hypothetical protein MUK42_04274 [Musa troglodytarum]|uniref:Uncharacterized protein n=1 Tax=Musa troglodytarum TaxID=320322 RepID=A0A9E7F9P3_9LILI|nr:hypothetical protein MUK42_04274 [Musa troglodytarum]URD91508.1 hypothetical protein MUK42_04274 [Musa troglodytarum]